MKNLYTTLALLLVAAGVGAWIYFNERGPIAQTGSTVLLRARPETVSSLALEPAAGERLELTRQNDGWQVHRVGTKSVAVPADEEVVDELLEATELLQSSAVVEDATAPRLKEFGLEKPQSTLIVDNSKIEFGTKASFDSSKVYARVTSGGEPQIALLPATIAEFVLKPFNEWRDKTALRVEAEQATKLSFVSPAFKAEFERVSKGEDGDPDQWRMLAPVEAPADAGTIKTLLEQLSLTKTSRFLEDQPKNLAQWGLDKPAATVNVTTDKGQSTLRVGRTVEGGRAAQNSTSRFVFVVPDALFALISRPMREWRDKSVLRFSTEDVQTMKVSARTQSATLEKDGTNWKQTGAANADPAPAVSQAALDMLLGLQGLTANKFIDKPQELNTYGLNKPALEVELGSSEWNGSKKVRLSSHNGKVYAQVALSGGYEPAVLVLDSSALEPFKLALDALFPATKNPAR